ncbi:MAG: phosphate/phosphite/phosphonate ABC transporter substrate-binding protein [Candidatus Eremiobacterota bacterium]
MIKVYSSLLILFLFLFISSCKTTPVATGTPVPASSPSPASSSNQKPLVLSCIPYASELKLTEGWQCLADYLSAYMGIPVKFEMKKTYKPLIDGLKSGEIDFANTGPLIYVKAHDVAGATPLVKPIPVSGKSPFYQSYVIVRKDSGIKTISQLKGKKFAFTDKESASGFLIPVLILSEAGIKDFKFFSDVLYTGDHDSSISAVYNGYADGAGVSNYLFAKGTNERLGDLEVIKKSDPIPTAPIVVRANMPPDVVKKIKDAFLSIDPDKKENRYFLDIIQVKSYIEATDKEYEPIRKAAKAIEKMGFGTE